MSPETDRPELGLVPVTTDRPELDLVPVTTTRRGENVTAVRYPRCTPWLCQVRGLVAKVR